MQNYSDFEEPIPYKKKIKKKAPPKAKHKHEFKPCVIEFLSVRLDETRGYIPAPSVRIASYCPLCGKVGDPSAGWYESPLWYFSPLTPAGQREIDPTTRTLPTFHTEDDMFCKYVDLLAAGAASGKEFV